MFMRSMVQILHEVKDEILESAIEKFSWSLKIHKINSYLQIKLETDHP